MKILQCDYCHAKVNNFSHWYDGARPRNMYELNCAHEVSDGITFNGAIICHDCLNKLTQLVFHNKITPDANSVLKKLKEYCDGQSNCKGCKYGIDGAVFMSCALSGIPSNWALDKTAKEEKHGLSDADNSEDQ